MEQEILMGERERRGAVVVQCCSFTYQATRERGGGHRERQRREKRQHKNWRQIEMRGAAFVMAVLLKEIVNLLGNEKDKEK